MFRRSPADIDLYSGALHEDIVDGGSVGPTYACLIGTQFQSLKYGDRFWYETDSSEGFTAGKLFPSLLSESPGAYKGLKWHTMRRSKLDECYWYWS